MLTFIGTVRFVSDLHLTAERTTVNARFAAFLADTARTRVTALFILGDLFEYWIGDDDLADPFAAGIAGLLHQLATSGTRIFFIAGNRDFLLGDDFFHASKMQRLDDAEKLGAGDTVILLMHGDTLCTDDTTYQAFRAQVRDSAWQKGFLAQPLAARKAAIEKVRMQSEKDKSHKSEAIMDVAPAAVEQALREHHYPRLIHGHTHRPAKHLHTLDGKNCERWVLSDWYQHGEYLRCDESGCTAIKL